MYEYFIGLRHLSSRARATLSTISLISILGVCLGVAALVTVISVTGGFQETFRDKVLGVNSHILVMSNSQSGLSDYRLIQELIEAEVEGIVETSPFIFHEMMIASASNLSGILIKGVDPDLMTEVNDLPDYIQADSPAARDEIIESLRYERYLPAEGNAPERIPNMIVGKTLAKKLRIQKGDTVQVVSPQHGIAGDIITSNSNALTKRNFRVIGFYDSGFHDYDSKLVIVHYTALQDFFSHKDTVTGIEIKVHDIFKSGEIRDQLRELFQRHRIIDWKDLNEHLFTSLQLQKIVLSIIMTFIVIVASFNIVGTLIMLVLDKQKEIAILKSMGASNGGIMRIFIFQGLFIGTLGTVLGLLLGYGLCELVHYWSFGLDPKVYLIESLPVKMVPWEFALVGAAAVLISFFATLYPSWWATQLEPVEGLRYD